MTAGLVKHDEKTPTKNKYPKGLSSNLSPFTGATDILRFLVSSASISLSSSHLFNVDGGKRERGRESGRFWKHKSFIGAVKGEHVHPALLNSHSLAFYIPSRKRQSERSGKESRRK